MDENNLRYDIKNDPIKFAAMFWPDLEFYKQQRKIIYSVWYNDETIVPAGHMLGKDFVSAFIALSFFLTRSPCRVITTSVDSKQLEGVLWGEIKRFIQTCKYSLDEKRGGPLIINHLHIRKWVNCHDLENRYEEPLSYLIGRVAAKGEGLSGHHIANIGDGIPRTLGIADEASGLEDNCIEKMLEWANRLLVIGNPYECHNYFKWAVVGKEGDSSEKGGDIPRNGVQDGYERKIIRIQAEDSPNVRFAFREIQEGKQPSGRQLVPGVLSYQEFCKRNRRWDIVKKTVGLKAHFYQGAELLLYPAEWLNMSEDVALALSLTKRTRIPRALGIDSGQGTANTTWTVIDELGVIEQISKQTKDTSVITGETKAIGKGYGIDDSYWMFDRGGGGLEHADRLRSEGYKVRTVGFGESASEKKKGKGRGKRARELIVHNQERTYTYINKRGLMYGKLREMLDITVNPTPFAIPSRFIRLRSQLALMPLMHDGEGRLVLPPKNKRDRNDKRKTLEEIIGHSPDEADSLCIAIYCMTTPPTKNIIGAAW